MTDIVDKMKYTYRLETLRERADKTMKGRDRQAYYTALAAQTHIVRGRKQNQ